MHIGDNASRRRDGAARGLRRLPSSRRRRPVRPRAALPGDALAASANERHTHLEFGWSLIGGLTRARRTVRARAGVGPRLRGSGTAARGLLAVAARERDSTRHRAVRVPRARGSPAQEAYNELFGEDAIPSDYVYASRRMINLAGIRSPIRPASWTSWSRAGRRSGCRLRDEVPPRPEPAHIEAPPVPSGCGRAPSSAPTRALGCGRCSAHSPTSSRRPRASAARYRLPRIRRAPPADDGGSHRLAGQHQASLRRLVNPELEGSTRRPPDREDDRRPLVARLRRRAPRRRGRVASRVHPSGHRGDRAALATPRTRRPQPWSPRIPASSRCSPTSGCVTKTPRWCGSLKRRRSASCATSPLLPPRCRPASRSCRSTWRSVSSANWCCIHRPTGSPAGELSTTTRSASPHPARASSSWPPVLPPAPDGTQRELERAWWKAAPEERGVRPFLARLSGPSPRGADGGPRVPASRPSTTCGGISSR